MALGLGVGAAHYFTMIQLLALVEKGSLYQLIHTLALLWLIGRSGRANALARWFFFLGIALFSGSFYAKALYWPLDISIIAPLGGFFLALGWAFLALGGGLGRKP